MEVPVLIDGRNVYDPADARRAGFEYHSMGRESIIHHFPVVASVTEVPRRKAAPPVTKAQKNGAKIRAVVN